MRCITTLVISFFSVQNGNVLTSHIITKIEVKADIEEDYLYYDNTFYVNASMQLNRLLYTLMSILRMLFKYVAFCRDIRICMRRV